MLLDTILLQRLGYLFLVVLHTWTHCGIVLGLKVLLVQPYVLLGFMMQQASVWKDVACIDGREDRALVMIQHARHASCDTLERCVLARTRGQICRGATELPKHVCAFQSLHNPFVFAQSSFGTLAAQNMVGVNCGKC